MVIEVVRVCSGLNGHQYQLGGNLLLVVGSSKVWISELLWQPLDTMSNDLTNE